LAVVKICLLDTGPIVAYFDPSEPNHDPCVEALDCFIGQFITTGAVIGEAMHFLVDHGNGPTLFIEFLKASNTKVVECCQPEDLRCAVSLMAKYADTPMDFADATLVLLADALGQYDICTLDRRGFNTFRTAKGKRFKLVIDES
jgi:predicted nucleic acid-binding protein